MQIGKAFSYNMGLGNNTLRVNQSQQINRINSPFMDIANRSYDKMEISNSARNLYRDLSGKNSSVAKFNSRDIKVENNKKPKDDIKFKDTFIKMSLKYRDELDKVKNLDISEEEKNKLIEEINTSYESKMSESINIITDKFDDYFDKGRLHLDNFTRDEVEDIFDEDEFKSNLKTKVTKLRDMIVNSPNLKNIKQIKDVFEKKEKSTLDLEDMSFSDMEIIGKFIVDKKLLNNDDSKYTMGGLIAKKENDNNELIELLYIPDYIKESMYRVNKRVSEGDMREKAYDDELEKYREKLKNLNDRLDTINDRVGVLETRLQGVEDEYGINPKNRILMRSLKNESNILNKYFSVKHEKDILLEELNRLNTNKEEVVEFDFYKRMKAYYNEVIISFDKEDEGDDTKDKDEKIVF